MNNSEQNLDTLTSILKRWRVWLGLIMMLLPGILYQIAFKNASPEQYSGSAIVIFLLVSFYYSLPYIIIASIFVIFVFVKNKQIKKFDEIDVFMMGLLSIVLYWFQIRAIPFFLPMLTNFIYQYVLLFVAMMFWTIILHYWERKDKSKVDSKNSVRKI